MGGYTFFLSFLMMGFVGLSDESKFILISGGHISNGSIPPAPNV